MKKMLSLVVLLTVCAYAHAESILNELSDYGKAVVASVKKGAIEYRTVIKTTESPLRAYQLTFVTNAKELMSKPNADKDVIAYAINSARTEMWQTKFCTSELKKLMTQYQLVFNCVNKVNYYLY